MLSRFAISQSLPDAASCAFASTLLLVPTAVPTRPRSTLLAIVLLWIGFYASFTLVTPPLLDDADSVHVEVAREMLLRHDYVTLYANGIRYLEKAPLLYWSMAAAMRAAQLLGASRPEILAAAARFPLALAMLALALLLEAFARRMFGSARAGLYAALITLSSFGLFLFTRITIPDIGVCLFTTLAMYALYRTEEAAEPRRVFCYLFAVACALNVLTKGLIGVVFPVAIALLYLLTTRGLRGTLIRLRELHPFTSTIVFLAIAAPWHILAGLANPGHGHPAPFVFAHGHWQVPLPTDGNVRGWFWFYFMNEHLLRYLNLRVPHDYDTAPLWLFWGLCLVWMMPWSAFLPSAVAWALPVFGSSARTRDLRTQLRTHTLPLAQRGLLLLILWAAFVLLFFSLSTRQEYYVLPALPALALLLAGWLAKDSPQRSYLRALSLLLILGALFAIVSLFLLIRYHEPANTDLASLLTQNPSDYALSLGHFLDLTGPAIALFRVPLTLAASSLFFGPLCALLLYKRARHHAANLALATGAFGFLLAAHLGLQTFAPVLTSAQLAESIRPQLQTGDLLCIHGEYESGSTLGFYLQRANIHILEGRSSNLWYGSFFPDAPHIFETPASLAAKWPGPQRIFLWQSLTDPPNQLPALPGPVYILVKSGGKEIVSNQPNR
jgi:4-amino-4-deoxy-L-arabinose transferase-like glycosyltransferase